MKNWESAAYSSIIIGVLSWLCTTANAVGADKTANQAGTVSKAAKKASPAPKAEDDEESSGNFDFEADDGQMALAVPAEMLGKAAKSERLRFNQALRGLLLEGMSPDGAAAAKRHFEIAHQAVGSDPRAAYAYGIAFLEQKNSKEALAQFRAAARHAKGTYLPALQSVVWVQILRKEISPGLSAMTELARRLEESQAAWPNERDRMHSAEWLGRMVGFLSGPGTSADNTAPVAETAAAIDGILTGERKLAYERTRKSISKRQKDLETLASRPIAEVISEAKAKRQEARESLETAEADIKRIEEEIRTVRKPFEQQIAEAKLEIRANGQKVSNASKELPDAQEKVEELSVPRQYPNGYVRSYRNVPVGVRTRNETGQERKSRESQLAAAQQRLQTLKSTIDNAQQNMSEVRKQTETAQSEMRSAIAAIQPKLREARQKSQECAAQLKELEHETLTPEHVKSRVTALNSYVPFDTLREKDRLLATLKSAND